MTRGVDACRRSGTPSTVPYSLCSSRLPLRTSGGHVSAPDDSALDAAASQTEEGVTDRRYPPRRSSQTRSSSPHGTLSSARQQLKPVSAQLDTNRKIIVKSCSSSFRRSD